MANLLFDKGKEALLSAGVNWGSDTIKAALVTSSYTPNTATHQFLSDLGATRVGTDQALGTKSVTAGKATCGTITWSAVTTGSTVNYVVFYKDTGVAGTSALIVIDDTATGSPGLPLTTNGGDVIYTPDGTNGILKL